jgi:hypothetical protein
MPPERVLFCRKPIKNQFIDDELRAGGAGCAKNPVRDLAALAVLEERGVPEAISDACSAGRGGQANAMLYKKNIGILF